MAKRVLVIEDDGAIREGVTDALSFEGFDFIEAGDGKRGRELALTCECDLVLLDLALPEVEGFEILDEVRKSRPTLPVIVMTARGREADKVRGLKIGADDYVVKPFSVKELMARVSAVLRRSAERPGDVTTVRLPSGTVDFARSEIRYTDGTTGSLSEREVELLRYVVTNPKRVLSREEILSKVWRLDPHGVETRTVDMQMARLREKLRDDPKSPMVIRTVRGKGYVYAGPEPEHK